MLSSFGLANEGDTLHFTFAAFAPNQELHPDHKSPLARIFSSSLIVPSNEDDVTFAKTHLPADPQRTFI